MSESPNEEPVRWLEDPSAGANLRADLGYTAKAGAGGVDYAATLVALRGAIASQTGALAPAAIAGKSVGLKAAIGGLVLGGIAGLWAIRSEPDPVHGGGAIAAKPAAAQAVEAEQRIDDVSGPNHVRPVDHVATPSVPSSIGVSPDDDADADPEPSIIDDARGPESDKPLRKPRVTESTPAEPHDDADDYMREARLVALARKQLGADPVKALASTQKHGREFPHGALVEERRAIEVRALAQLDRMDDARQAAESFLREFGDGPHAAAVRRAVAGDDDVQ